MRKETLLLIPGTACDETVWEHQKQHLTDVANIFIADLSESYTIDSMISQALKNLPESFLLAGHSLGACVCLEIIKRYPKRVKKLCLLATQAGLDNEKVLEKRRKRIEMARKNEFDSVAMELTELFTYQTNIKPAVYEMFKNNRKLFISTQEAAIKRECNVSLLPLINQPTLVIVGRNDKIFFASTQFIADKIPGAQFSIVEDCGHMLTMEKPEAITELMRHWIMS